MTHFFPDTHNRHHKQARSLRKTHTRDHTVEIASVRTTLLLTHAKRAHKHPWVFIVFGGWDWCGRKLGLGTRFFSRVEHNFTTISPIYVARIQRCEYDSVSVQFHTENRVPGAVNIYASTDIVLVFNSFYGKRTINLWRIFSVGLCHEYIIVFWLWLMAVRCSYLFATLESLPLTFYTCEGNLIFPYVFSEINRACKVNCSNTEAASRVRRTVTLTELYLNWNFTDLSSTRLYAERIIIINDSRGM